MFTNISLWGFIIKLLLINVQPKSNKLTFSISESILSNKQKGIGEAGKTISTQSTKFPKKLNCFYHSPSIWNRGKFNQGPQHITLCHHHRHLEFTTQAVWSVTGNWQHKVSSFCQHFYPLSTAKKGVSRVIDWKKCRTLTKVFLGSQKLSLCFQIWK